MARLLNISVAGDQELAEVITAIQLGYGASGRMTGSETARNSLAKVYSNIDNVHDVFRRATQEWRERHPDKDENMKDWARSAHQLAHSAS